MTFFYEIAVPVPLQGPFTYKADKEILAGCRVAVPFGPRLLIGVVLKKVPEPKETTYKIKAVKRIVDNEPIYSEVLMDVALFMHRYYFHPHGETFKVMLPSGVAAKAESYAHLTAKGLLALKEGKAKELKSALRGRKVMKLVTLKKKKDVDILSLTKEGLLTIEASIKPRETASLDAKENLSISKEQTLTPKQAEVYNAITAKMSPDTSETWKPFLLKGVTGSGKTEIYLQIIRYAFDTTKGAQALLLVPEISLTPQMTRVFEARFSDAVAVVHSAMSPAHRWQQLERVRHGSARILIGPRSAVFAPFMDLKLVIVDEEHDGSYKQSTGLCYHGRDIAVFRARLEKAALVLGSATPSLESFHNAKTGRYHFLELNERVGGRPLPSVELIEMVPSKRMGQRLESSSEDASLDLGVSPLVIDALQENLDKGHQSIVLVNRRGYSSYLFDLKEKKAVVCPQCSISLTVHKRNRQLRCHYCDYQTSVAAAVKGEEHRFLSVGYGSQQAELFLQQKLPSARIVRVDSDTASRKGALAETLEKFAAGKIDILLGTQMLAKGHDYPSVTLTVILEIDQLLSLPDFRAGERAFQLMVQAGGRAGRGQLKGKVMVQTAKPQHPIIKAGLAQDFDTFVSHELSFRKNQGYPPYTKMAAIELSASCPSTINHMNHTVESWVDAQLATKTPLPLQILGPSVPPIDTIRGRSRRSVVFFAEQMDPLRQCLGRFLYQHTTWPKDGRMKVDVDPQVMI